MTKYYLIEEYSSGSRYDNSSKEYDVRSFDSKDQLKEAFLEGPKRRGRLFVAKGLEVKIQIVDTEQEGFAQDLTQRFQNE